MTLPRARRRPGSVCDVTIASPRGPRIRVLSEPQPCLPAHSVTSSSCGWRAGVGCSRCGSPSGWSCLASWPSTMLAYSGPSAPWYSPGEFSIGETARFGQALFASIMAAQAAMVLGLTPALVADAIASERQRKTLHHLLASPLGSGEIVLGKLAARLLAVGMYPALVLPIMSLLTLIGGVSPAGLVLGYAALASSAYFLAGLALLASVLARRPRDAIGAAYLLTAAWLFLPPLLDVCRLHAAVALAGDRRGDPSGQRVGLAGEPARVGDERAVDLQRRG